MTDIHLKPTKGRIVRMPERSFMVMPADGASVTRNSYYTSLIRFGDVEVTEEPKSKPSPKDKDKEVK